jgi:4'-phosphopantetheinyl transferase EntD
MITDTLRVPGCPRAIGVASAVPGDRTPEAQRTAGEHAAIAALADAGCVVTSMPARATRVPVWPEGYVGSIAHDAALAVAVAAPLDAVTTIGVDVERHDALDAADARLVLTEDERLFVARDAGRATRIWCAKEAAYKAWCTALGAELDGVDPRSIVVTPSAPAAVRVDARDDLARRVAEIGALQGRAQRVGDLLVVVVWKLSVRDR